MITGTVIVFLVGAFLLGMIIAFVLVTPARASMDRSARERNREEKTLERDLSDLRRQHAQLEAEHAGVVAERDHLRQQLATMSGAAPPVAVDATDVSERAQVTQRTETDTSEGQPGFGERLREMFHAPTPRDETSEDGARTSDRPPAPTA
ncbi:MAG: LapA family protein [Ktedonobacterales bacterium]